jgi:hypothetical protein
MSKAATQDLALTGIRHLMLPSERLAGLVRVVAGPWQYLVALFLSAAVVLELMANYVPGMVAALLALLCVMKIKSYALTLTDQALYIVRIQQRRVGTVEVIRPLLDVGFADGSLRLVLDGTPFWVQPLYLGADTEQFRRNLQAAAGVAVAY